MTPQVALLITVLLAGIPAGSARGGKAPKGAGGGGGGPTGLTNTVVREITWEDFVLAMQLSAMCFGALFAVCVVACCAYKICGPAEEVEWGGRYSVLKRSNSRQPPELLKEICTRPSSSTVCHSSTDKPPTVCDTAINTTSTQNTSTTTNTSSTPQRPAWKVAPLDNNHGVGVRTTPAISSVNTMTL